MKVAYILHGNYNLISRAKRQIKALEENGYEVFVFNGYFDEYNKDECNVKNFYHIRIKQGKMAFINFIYLLIFNVKIAIKIYKIDGFRIIICRELSTLLSGIILKNFNKNIKLIYDSNELSVETYSGIKRKVWFFLESYFVKNCDLIFHAEKMRMEYFSKIYSLKNKNQFLLPNYVEYNPYNPIKSQDMNILYFGSISPHRNLEEIVSVFCEQANLKLFLMGFGNPSYIEKLKKIISSKNNLRNNIVFLPPIDDSKIDEEFIKYKIGIAFYPNDNLNNLYCAPNKVFQYIQNNMAVITTNNPPLVDLIDKYRFGVYLENITKDSIKWAINEIIEKQLWNNITEDVKKELSWEKIKPIFIKKIKEIQL